MPTKGADHLVDMLKTAADHLRSLELDPSLDLDPATRNLIRKTAQELLSLGSDVDAVVAGRMDLPRASDDRAAAVAGDLDRALRHVTDAAARGGELGKAVGDMAQVADDFRDQLRRAGGAGGPGGGGGSQGWP
ncbi:hypothetical protein [Benzoatithermus flavus]|uniref:Uncharacterized protein n=1 Tax=Benzoatithermus flavus TaxID=3108223 RepID=A0ABU8XMR3_9PROT